MGCLTAADFNYPIIAVDASIGKITLFMPFLIFPITIRFVMLYVMSLQSFIFHEWCSC